MTRDEKAPMIKRIPGAMALTMLLVLSGPSLAQTSADSPESDAPVQGQQQSRENSQDEQRQTRDDGRRGPRIYPTLAAGLIEMGVPVIDVRSEAEVEETGALAGAIHIPHTEIDAIVEFIGDDSSRAVVMYCGSGRRVGIAIDALRERGYHGMVNAGGFEDLQQALEAGDEG